MAEEAASGEERLWRERAARMTLDSLGHTNLTVKPHEHNATVRYARRWFRGLFDHADSAVNTFDAAGVILDTVKKEVLAMDPIIFEPEDAEDDEDGGPDTGSDRGEVEDGSNVVGFPGGD